jgi:hypothetical protein
MRDILNMTSGHSSCCTEILSTMSPEQTLPDESDESLALLAFLHRAIVSPIELDLNELD